ncbi:spore maturation protein [Desulfobacca acetoxidans]|uniref:Nucleoside recognition domain protein n=1 Tax=Desulfobacca acetoxidans (strain ATCC 700848 / DSM 11109 / ASRB2) TaxID=880072 RepID=F2ND28_DESAR|nr:nucleoside recognition domain-containing protein [Desulfobacca acetoxidans]AEB09752.1 nucleoside recognition domain protein [Desulfobacca acetoxidans DSM 11109]
MEKLQVSFQYIIPLFIFFTVAYGFARKTPVYESFVSGAKDGINIIVGIFPYVLAIFIMVKTLQASGAHDFFKKVFAAVAAPLHLPPEIFSIALVKPMSNAATLGIFTEILKTTGPDSLASIISAVIMGSAETTFYVIAVYLGSVGIRKSRYLVPVCLTADLVGIAVAVTVVMLLF